MTTYIESVPKLTRRSICALGVRVAFAIVASGACNLFWLIGFRVHESGYSFRRQCGMRTFIQRCGPCRLLFTQPYACRHSDGPQESIVQRLVVIPRSQNVSSLVLRQQDLEAEVVRQLYADGTIRQIWRRAEGGACMLTEAADSDSRAHVLSQLPLVKMGYLSEPQLSQLRPYSGFGPRA
jgi:muconolactone delta-isomerase